MATADFHSRNFGDTKQFLDRALCKHGYFLDYYNSILAMITISTTTLRYQKDHSISLSY